MTDFTKLIPELPDWNNGKGIDVESWIDCIGTFQLAVGYSTLFWPRFVEFDGYILREGFSIQSLRGFQHPKFESLSTQANTSRRGIESVMNHLHIAYIHFQDLSHCTVDHALYLGRVLQEIYQVKLAWQFPTRRFEVVFDDSEREDVVDYEITFYQSDDVA